jgi:hypothetical protein
MTEPSFTGQSFQSKGNVTLTDTVLFKDIRETISEAWHWRQPQSGKENS